MATPTEKLADSLEALHVLQKRLRALKRALPESGGEKA